jgi:hypothetical protein
VVGRPSLEINAMLHWRAGGRAGGRQAMPVNLRDAYVVWCLAGGHSGGRTGGQASGIDCTFTLCGQAGGRADRRGLAARPSLKINAMLIRACF